MMNHSWCHSARYMLGRVGLALSTARRVQRSSPSAFLLSSRSVGYLFTPITSTHSVTRSAMSSNSRKRASRSSPSPSSASTSQSSPSRAKVEASTRGVTTRSRSGFLSSNGQGSVAGLAARAAAETAVKSVVKRARTVKAEGVTSASSSSSSTHVVAGAMQFSSSAAASWVPGGQPPPLEAQDEESAGLPKIKVSEEEEEDDRANERPENWRHVHAAIKYMRRKRDAPVDTMGCERLADPEAEPKVFRFQTLVSLMLSSMTKDETTAQAVANLNAHWEDGLTVPNVRSASVKEIDAEIRAVGFHNRKSDYLKRTAEILHKEYDDDIPDSIEGLCALPGVGPKMSFICMRVAWKKVVGLGVDVHVHRISNRLGWVDSKNPEDTREQLEAWLPRDKWDSLNEMLVGFGQTICSAKKPQCETCLALPYCPTGPKQLQERAQKAAAKKRKAAAAAKKRKAKKAKRQPKAEQAAEAAAE